MSHVHIPYYLDFLSAPLLEAAASRASDVEGIPGLKVGAGLMARYPQVESEAALSFVVSLTRAVAPALRRCLEEREAFREFVDRSTLSFVEENRGVDYQSVDYKTVLGLRDDEGRVVVGPGPPMGERAKVHVPASMQGEQVTLFGPPDTPRMSINAMNALHRSLPGEDPLVAELLAEGGQVPRWGADSEDSVTPISANLMEANRNLQGCYDRTLGFVDEARGREYRLAEEGLSTPIKRIPGLGLPDANHLLDGEPIPLHILDLGFQLFHNWDHPEALVLYVPKLESEAEAAYFKTLVETAERQLKALHPSYELGSVRLFVVFENPRAIFRIREMAEALAPYFVGGSLGWHDFLGATARLFRHDPNYRIPVKSDPDIVINHIRESHLLLVDALEPIGGVKIGGMYGVLYEDGNARSFEVSMVGYVKDVVTQLKRGLDGFWVAHPNFVRLGLALVQAWRRKEADPGDESLEALIKAIITDPAERRGLLEFVHGPDAPGLSKDDPLYLRAVLASELGLSEVMPNHHPEEVRYNVFQALQYLADWLRGNGCVALPALVHNASGEPVFVRVMDDLATTERSRWQLWAEVYHQRVSLELLEQIFREEVDFIRDNRATPTRRVQVPWDGDAAPWYPMAVRILWQLVTDPDPVEFVTELLMPFTLTLVREAPDPWETAKALCPGRYQDDCAVLDGAEEG